jgi:hypothetical protein
MKRNHYLKKNTLKQMISDTIFSNYDAKSIQEKINYLKKKFFKGNGVRI